MKTLSSLERNSFEPGHPVARNAAGPVTWEQFLADVDATRAVIGGELGAEWALFESDTYRFAVGLIALLGEGKRVYIPGENHAGLVRDLVLQRVRFLGLFPSAECSLAVASGGGAVARPLRLGGAIVVFTSGSTGDAKSIPKSLAQLDAELLAQENLWGERLAYADIMGTVSHQHLYGLLFSVLWPLCAGRCFWYRPFVDPVAMARQAAVRPRSAWVMSPAHLHRLGANMPWQSVAESLALIFSSGGALATDAALTIGRDCGQTPVEIFGSSETGGIAWRQQSAEQSSWQPLPGVEFRFTKESALAVRSPFLPDEQWYITDDAATPAAPGGFLLGGRLDRIVKIEGKRVALAEVEQALLDRAEIGDACAIVLARKRPCVGALLVLSPQGWELHRQLGHADFTRQLRHALGDCLAAAAVPRAFRLAPVLPRNTQGKLLRKEIEQHFESETRPRVLRHESRDNGCQLQLAVSPNCQYFEGHFPDNPILPGVVQLKWAEDMAREWLGVDGPFQGMRSVKFKKVILPGTVLTLALDYTPGNGRLDFRFSSVAGEHSQGRMQYGLRS